MGFLEKVIGSLLGIAWIVAGIVAGENLGWLPGTIFTVLNLILPRDVFASFGIQLLCKSGEEGEGFSGSPGLFLRAV